MRYLTEPVYAVQNVRLFVIGSVRLKPLSVQATTTLMMQNTSNSSTVDHLAILARALFKLAPFWLYLVKARN